MAVAEEAAPVSAAGPCPPGIPLAADDTVFADDAADDDFPTRWSLAVCRTCGRIASWPFCAHRGTDGSWFTTIVVRGRVPARDRLP